MDTLMYILIVFGAFEVLSNLIHLINIGRGKGLKSAKIVHGDFPPTASNTEWMGKILSMLVLGIIALVTAHSIYKDFSTANTLLYIFTAGMLLVGIVQAVKYGKKHIPAVGSFVLSIVFVALVYFLQ